MRQIAEKSREAVREREGGEGEGGRGRAHDLATLSRWSATGSTVYFKWATRRVQPRFIQHRHFVLVNDAQQLKRGRVGTYTAEWSMFGGLPIFYLFLPVENGNESQGRLSL